MNSQEDVVQNCWDSLPGRAPLLSLDALCLHCNVGINHSSVWAHHTIKIVQHPREVQGQIALQGHASVIGGPLAPRSRAAVALDRESYTRALIDLCMSLNPTFPMTLALVEELCCRQAFVLCRASVLSSGTLGAAMEASLAHRRAVAVSFPFNGWNSWTDDDIATAVKVERHPLLPAVLTGPCHVYLSRTLLW